jgi:hypothetical protein
MTELKTLKDFIRCIPTPEELNYGDIYIPKQELRQEAIKWIKEIRKNLCIKCRTPLEIYQEPEHTDPDDQGFYCLKCQLMTTRWGDDRILIEFFNITEEELK